MADNKAVVGNDANFAPPSNRTGRQEIAAVDSRQAALDTAYALADSILMKNYLVNMQKYEIVPFKEAQIQDVARLFKVTRLIYDKEENNQEKLLNVYNALYACGASLVLLLKSDGTKVDFYLGTKASSRKMVPMYQEILEKSVNGNFCGTEMQLQRDRAMTTLLDEVLLDKEKNCQRNVAAVTSMAGFRDGHTMKPGDFVQGLEKLADAMRGEKYTLVIVADPVVPEALNERRSGYEALYSQLLPFSATEMTFGQNESEAVAKSLTHGTSEAITESVAKMTSHSHGTTHSQSDTAGTSDTKGTSNTAGVSAFGGTNAGLSVAPFGIGGSFGAMAGGGASFSRTWSKSHTDSQSHTDTSGTTDTNTAGSTKTNGKMSTSSDATGKTDTHTTGKSVSYTTHLENRYVKTLLERIDTQLARIDECMDVGMWDCAADVIADNERDSRMIAGTYQALIRGKESGTESAAITVWNDDQSRQVADYLRNMSHPWLRLSEAVTVTPAAVLSGEDLTVAAGLPQQSLPGLPVDTYACFGREIVRSRHASADKADYLSLGHIYHMGQEEKTVPAWLDVDALTAHTFVTGSTGSGKSNTICKLMEELREKKIPWLVIEPAKGEYKDSFGGLPDVEVYGTNPYKVPNFLHINPFSFPEDVHVLEHIDRLAEIFNACWPMYAAMPAILREAMERAYEECGWNLKTSKNPGQFPTFRTLLEILPQVIDASAYSADTTSDYKGALVTRVRSLTRGIHGLIFSDDTTAEALFDRNVIVDLSRVGSQETKSLIMGILVLKLQEHRMADDMSPNSALCHITVLEEAHHLLRRTSSEQVQESANLMGQAVAMLANSIAEMRTYGEGFVIADQSPGLMDMSVVRNTNTKIILRLPDESDRELVGKAAGLTDAQIEELAFLERGVAAIYQSDWAEAVLAKVAKFDTPKPMPVPTGGFAWEDEETKSVRKFLDVSMEVESQDFSPEEMEQLRKWYRGLNLNETARATVEKVLHGKALVMAQKALLLCHIAGKQAIGLPKDETINQVENILSGRYGVKTGSKVIEAMRQVLIEKLPDDSELKIADAERREGVVV